MKKLWDWDTNHCPTQHSCCQGKTFGKNHPFIIKDSDLEVEGNYLNLKATMKMPTVKSHPLEKWRNFSTRTMTFACTVARQLGLARATRQIKRKASSWNEVKLSVHKLCDLVPRKQKIPHKTFKTNTLAAHSSRVQGQHKSQHWFYAWAMNNQSEALDCYSSGGARPCWWAGNLHWHYPRQSSL